MSRLKILIIGYGSIGKKHHECLIKNFKEYEVKIFSKKNIKKSEFIKDIDKALAYKPNISLICNPASYHISTAIKFAKIGSHLFIEKPIDINLQKIKILKNYIKKNNLKVQIGYNLRYLESLNFFKKIIFEKKYGKPIFFESQVGQNLRQWRNLDQDLSKSISLNSSLGGGVIFELSHEIDYLRWIFGEFNNVNSFSAKLFFRKSDVEDFCTVNFAKCKNRNISITGSLSLDMIRTVPIRICKVITDKGFILWDGLRNTIEISSGKDIDKIKFKNDSIKSTYIKQFKDFFNSIQNNIETSYNLEEAIKTYNLIRQIRKG